MVSALTPPAPDGSPPPTLFARKVEKLAAMGEAESLNEMAARRRLQRPHDRRRRGQRHDAGR